ncbi:hypothetical protein KC19_11G077300 [Ceratodon purpureus]|uniref:Lipoxygenase n=1 Tax=Ceratodon purpureus TaxID=3225 RepID=A0A8T0GCM3_CERPU|nr:hypothetical protein KC19_N038700 [Ceratodon purpureus]KAG0504370.1 hypothetical protein KC19_N038700 [Ceratodon purpureus]KAG0504372.1 hypothetical protein KC19_N038700 [Ceratodon purpureus]KAG0504374.1 hypothetical protein KC19_N038700 [Ceratodon purpureus]KAG0504375.1 hypothetical protein KC19_N038700 [Ceratodon purpureus]
MVASAAEHKDDPFFLKSPRELYLLFAGGEITTSKPKPDPVPDTPKEAVPLTVKSSSSGNTIVTNHTDWLSKLNPFSHFGGTSSDPSKDPNLVLYKAKVSIERASVKGFDINNPISDLVELGQELISNHVTLQLVSNDLDPATQSGKLSGKVTVEHWGKPRDLFIPTVFEFDLKFYVPKDFGVPGAIIVNNGHRNLVLLLSKITITTEFNLKDVKVTLPDNSVVNFACNSWVYASDMNKSGHDGRVFFVNKEYTPATTPPGLVKLRENELKELQGSGTGERKIGERVYDYDVYNDLGTPENTRNILGGSSEYPYPRRCRTGRKLNKDGKTETRPGGLKPTNYIPVDEYFNAVKKSGFFGNFVKAQKHNLVANMVDFDKQFRDFDEVRSMYVPIGEESKVEEYSNNQQQPFELIRNLAFASGDDRDLLKYPTPRIIASDKNAWTKDEEFARQTLAGMNPLLIETLKEFPLKRPSAVTAAIIEPQLEGLSISEAIAKKKLFVLDYHDRFMGYIQRINELKGSKAYASWTLFFLTNAGILKPVCIELALPSAVDGDTPKLRVFRPAEKGATKNWAWELAKAHVQSNDASWHQVISHWLRTHACIEPFIIATNRQLSIMHPVNKALHPHYKNTMDINQQARTGLINAGGIVEQTFTPGKYSIEISSVVYRGWRFVDQALPNDLIKRGMAVPDPSAPHGLKLVIDDYPYANDGLELWAAIRKWVKDHIDIFYADDAAVLADAELQKWWTEARTVGHGDITEGWIMADSKDNLVQIVTIIIWVASCHHAAVNFGQYLYAGFMPNHPSLTSKLIPEEDTPEWDSMQQNPEKYLLAMLANPVQARINMTTIEILSTHSSEEEYLGQREAGWTDNSKVLAAFDSFSKKVEEIDALIKSRNANPSLKNRNGPVKVPYELLRPLGVSKEGGLTNKGIPNSISI